MEGVQHVLKRRDQLRGQHWCSSGLWRLREHTWTINGKFQEVDAALGFGFETQGHTWTIDWTTISIWPWSRERGLERSGGYRDCNGILATRTTRIDGSQPLYSSPAWSWGSQINIWFPHDVESWLWWTHLLNSSFDNGTGYFDNDNGQTLFFEGILMDIMVDNGEIWWNFSVSGLLAPQSCAHIIMRH